MNPNPAIRFFVVFEPSYSLGCLSLLSSLARHASRPIVVDLLMRPEYHRAADKIMYRLREKYGERILLRPVMITTAILEQCRAHRFKAHFIPEILFRLYYFELVDDPSDFVIYLDLDMIVLGDIFTVVQSLAKPALLHAVEAELTPISRDVSPPHVTRYLNSGFLVFDGSDRAALAATLKRAREVVAQIAENALFLDQDAINVAFYGNIDYLPSRWNFILEHFKGYPIPADIMVLHATGSRKPWFFRGGHPYSPWYEKEADILRLSFAGRHDYWWAPRRLLKKTRALFA